MSAWGVPGPGGRQELKAGRSLRGRGAGEGVPGPGCWEERWGRSGEGSRELGAGRRGGGGRGRGPGS